MGKEIYVPQGIRVLVVPEGQKEKTEAGIIVTESRAFTAFTKAKVFAIGDEVKRFSVGDTVLFGAGKGEPIMVNDTECKLLFEPDIDIVVSN